MPVCIGIRAAAGGRVGAGYVGIFKACESRNGNLQRGARAPAAVGATPTQTMAPTPTPQTRNALLLSGLVATVRLPDGTEVVRSKQHKSLQRVCDELRLRGSRQ